MVGYIKMTIYCYADRRYMTTLSTPALHAGIGSAVLNPAGAENAGEWSGLKPNDYET
jgi:hypothetical protein